MALENTRKYDDIIHMEYHGVQRHTKMPMNRRAAQFSKFAALDDDGAENEIDDFSADDIAKSAKNSTFGK